MELGPHVRGHRGHARRQSAGRRHRERAAARRRGRDVTAEDGQLRTGLTTGTCAAAAAAAAARALAGEALRRRRRRAAGRRAGHARRRVGGAAAGGLRPRGRRQGRRRRPRRHRRDDRRRRGRAAGRPAVGRPLLRRSPPAIEFAAGAGVGTVTRAGLQLAPGEPAINPVPREMIAAAVRAVLPDGRAARDRRHPRRRGDGAAHLQRAARHRGRALGPRHVRARDPQVRGRLAAVAAAAGGRGAGRRARHRVPRARDASASAPRASAFGAAETQIVQCSNFVGDLLDRCADAGRARGSCSSATPASWSRSRPACGTRTAAWPTRGSRRWRRWRPPQARRPRS